MYLENIILRDWVPYTSYSVEDDRKHDDLIVGDDVKRKCEYNRRASRKSFASKPTNTFVHSPFERPTDRWRDFSVPITLTCRPDGMGDKELYLHVFGVRRTVYLQHILPVVDIKLPYHHLSHRETFVLYLHSLGVKGVRDCKIVCKRPFEGACAGLKLFWKLYLDGHEDGSTIRTLRNALKENAESPHFEQLDRNHLHDVSLKQHVKWMISQNAASSAGRLRMTEDVFLQDRGAYVEACVHHKDVLFDNMSEVSWTPSVISDENEALSVWDTVMQDTVWRAVMKTATGPTLNVFKSKIAVARSLFLSTSNEKRQGAFLKRWTYQKLKKVFLKPIFDFINNDMLDHSYDAIIKRDGGYSMDESLVIGGITLDRALLHVFLEGKRILSHARCHLKILWRDTMCRPTEGARRQHLTRTALEVSDQHKRWLLYDIETDFRPHEIKEESIIMISTVLFRHADTEASQYRLFYRLPHPGAGQCNGNVGEYGKQELDRHYRREEEAVDVYEVMSSLRPLLQKGDYTSMKAGTNFRIEFFRSEKDMLQRFRDYCWESHISFVGYFNGNKFDFPFVANRYAVSQTLSETRRASILKKNLEERKFTMRFPFTRRSYVAHIRYEQQLKSHNHKTHGVSVYTKRLLKEQQQHKAGVFTGRKRKNLMSGDYFDDVVDDDDDDDDDDDEMGDDVDELNNSHDLIQDARRRANMVKSANSSKTQLPLYWRHIESVSMKDVTMVDVMHLVSENRKRGCSLSTASKKLLGMDKLDDPCVQYENMFNTWVRGDKVKLAVYSMLDTMLLEKLIRVKKTAAFYGQLSEILGLPDTEIYLDDTVRRLISLAHCFGHTESLLTPDTTLMRHDEYMWVPGFVFESSRDYANLRPPAGSTVPDVQGNYNVPCATVDFKSQYPSIMAAYNYCMTSVLTEQQIIELDLTEDVHYVRVVLENVKPTTVHVCRERGIECYVMPEKEKTEHGLDEKRLGHAHDPRKCKYDVRFEKVQREIFFCKAGFYPSLLNRSSRTLTQIRSRYKRLASEATEKGDPLAANTYKVNDLAVKTVANSMYGSTMRLNACVGDAITKEGRKQSRDLARLALSKNMRVVNGDTDSVFITMVPTVIDAKDFGSLAKFFGLDPRKSNVVDIMGAMVAAGKAFCDEANDQGVGKLYEKPCFLEYEKLFMHIHILAKKCYTGIKLTSDNEIQVHVAGVTGKKADSTVVKTAVQSIAHMLMGRQDHMGMITFLRDVYDLAGWEIHLQCRLDGQVAAVAEHISAVEGKQNSERSENARQKIRDLRHSAEERETDGLCLVPRSWIMSNERVGNMECVPLSLPTKKALLECKIRGEGKDKAPLKIELCRGSSVQIAAGLKKTLLTFLSAPPTDDFSKGHDQRYAESHKESEVRKRKRLRKDAASRIAKAKETTTKLDVTAMPEEYRVQDKMKHHPTDHERDAAERLMEYVDEREAAYATESKKPHTVFKMASEPDVVSSRDTELQKRRLERTKKRLHDYMTTTPRDQNLLPPLKMFSSDMTVCRKEHMDSSVVKGVVQYEMKDRFSSADLWGLYLNDMVAAGEAHIALWWKNDRVRIRFFRNKKEATSQIDMPFVQFKPDHCSWLKDNVHTLNDECTLAHEKKKKAKKKHPEGPCYLIDMMSYRSQTQSTPYVSPSYKGFPVVLINRDSYVENEKDSFSFVVKSIDLLEALHQLEDNVHVYLGNVYDSSSVHLQRPAEVYVRCQGDIPTMKRFPVCCITRRDGRRPRSWMWREEECKINRKKFILIANAISNASTMSASESIRNTLHLVLRPEKQSLTISDVLDCRQKQLKICFNGCACPVGQGILPAAEHLMDHKPLPHPIAWISSKNNKRKQTEKKEGTQMKKPKNENSVPRIDTFFKTLTNNNKK